MTEKLYWRDSLEIAQALADTHANIDPRTIRYTDLHRWICALPDFKDNPEACNEQILESIQTAWIDEVAE
ncbi:MAG: Fe-S cluster assembly protein IscX [Burkholderiales bacterium]|nr:Fe-S cluster assembly protein IscX [Burkholderiales bacterium]